MTLLAFLSAYAVVGIIVVLGLALLDVIGDGPTCLIAFLFWPAALYLFAQHIGMRL